MTPAQLGVASKCFRWKDSSYVVTKHLARELETSSYVSRGVGRGRKWTSDLGKHDVIRPRVKNRFVSRGLPNCSSLPVSVQTASHMAIPTGSRRPPRSARPRPA